MKKHFKKLLAAVVLSLAVICMPMTALAAENDVASVDGNEYATLQQAIDAADGKTVTLLSNVKESVTIPENTTVTLDLANYTLTNVDGQHTITNKGTLTIQGNGTVDNTSHARGALVNNGTATLAGGTLKRSLEAGDSPTNNGGNSWYVVDNNGGTMTVTGGKIINKSGYSSLIRNLGATFNMQGGELSNGFIALKNDDNGKINMTGGTISTTGVGGSAIQNWGDLNVSGGTLNASADGVAVYALTWKDEFKSKAVITDGAKINGNIKMAIDGAGFTVVPELEINGGVIKGNFDINAGSKLTLNDGNFSGTIASADGQGVVTVNGGNFAVKPADEYITSDSTVAKLTSSATESYVIGTADDVAVKLANTTAGDKIEVMQGNVDVTLPNGVEVTNSGAGNVVVNGDTIDKDGSVVTHTHNAVKVEAKEPTATEAGNIEYWYCAECGKYFSDAALTNEITLADTVIPATVEPSQPGTDETPDSDGTVSETPTENNNNMDAPQTGDNTNIILWVTLMVLAAGGLTGTTLFVKKRKAE